MDLSRIDELIFAEVGTHWTKVARVIGVAHKSFNIEVSKIDEFGLVVQKRIEALIEAGKLASRGNLDNWLSSEICRSNEIKNRSKIEPNSCSATQLKYGGGRKDHRSGAKA